MHLWPSSALALFAGDLLWSGLRQKNGKSETLPQMESWGDLASASIFRATFFFWMETNLGFATSREALWRQGFRRSAGNAKSSCAILRSFDPSLSDLPKARKVYQLVKLIYHMSNRSWKHCWQVAHNFKLQSDSTISEWTWLRRNLISIGDGDAERAASLRLQVSGKLP